MTWYATPCVSLTLRVRSSTPSRLSVRLTGTVKCLNAAAGYLKKRAVAVARTAPRDDGFAPQRLSALFRFRVRCELQAAIMRGNWLIAAEVGL
jgi:hypothetical protein